MARENFHYRVITISSQKKQKKNSKQNYHPTYNNVPTNNKMKRTNTTTPVHSPTIVKRKEDTASEYSTPTEPHLELKRLKKAVEEGMSTDNPTNHVSNDTEHLNAAAAKVKPKMPSKKLDTPIAYSSARKKQYVTRVFTAGAAFNICIVRFKHGTNFNEDGFIKPFKDYLDGPKGAELASELRIIQVCKLVSKTNTNLLYLHTNRCRINQTQQSIPT